MTTLTTKLQSEHCGNSNFVFYSSYFNIEITLDKNISISDSFIITIYNDSLMLLDNAGSDKGLRQKRKKNLPVIRCS